MIWRYSISEDGMNPALHRLAQEAVRHGARRHAWLSKYTHLFKGFDLNGKSVLDIGAGVGWASFFAAIHGADRVVMIEPQSDGSRNYMLDLAARVRSDLNLEQTVQIVPSTLEAAQIGDTFDLIVIDNAINHLNEDACVALHTDWEARKAYWPTFEILKRALKPGGHIIATDCSNRNFFGDIGLRSPLAPTIRWHLHQRPEVWAQLLGEFGFEEPKISWNPVPRLGRIGHLGANKWGAYFTSSHFRLVMRRGASPAGAGSMPRASAAA